MEEYVRKLQEIFGGLDRAHGTYKIDEGLSGIKVGGQAMTIAKPPTNELWTQHLEGKRSLGIIPIREDGTISWACIDIDAYQSDVCKAAIKFVNEYALPFVVCRSKSGGAHVFVFFAKPIAARLVVQKMAGFAKSMGFEGAEIFPKQIALGPEEFGNWLNMPYFDWEISTRYGYDKDGKRLDLPAFIGHVESTRISSAGWKALEIPELEHPFSDGPPCLQGMARAKVTEGGRNNALLQFGVYAKLKYGEQDYQDKVSEYNHRYFDPVIGQRELNDTIFKSLERRDYGFICTQQPQVSMCNRQACLRRKYGIGGAADEEFEQEIEMHNLRKLIYFSPTGEPLDDEPDFELTIMSRTIRLTQEQLMSQAAFAKLCVAKFSIWPPAMPAPRWRELIKGHLSNSEIVEIPFETSPPAQTLEALKDYIKQNAHAKNNLDLLNGLALKKEECYSFRIESLVEFMRDRARAIIDIKKIADHLEVLGLSRSKTTARVGAETVSIACYEIGINQLDVFDDPKFDAPPPAPTEF